MKVTIELLDKATEIIVRNLLEAEAVLNFPKGFRFEQITPDVLDPRIIGTSVRDNGHYDLTVQVYMGREPIVGLRHRETMRFRVEPNGRMSDEEFLALIHTESIRLAMVLALRADFFERYATQTWILKP